MTPHVYFHIRLYAYTLCTVLASAVSKVNLGQSWLFCRLGPLNLCDFGLFIGRGDI